MVRSHLMVMMKMKPLILTEQFTFKLSRLNNRRSYAIFTSTVAIQPKRNSFVPYG